MRGSFTGAQVALQLLVSALSEAAVGCLDFEWFGDCNGRGMDEWFCGRVGRTRRSGVPIAARWLCSWAAMHFVRMILRRPIIAVVV